MKIMVIMALALAVYANVVLLFEDDTHQIPVQEGASMACSDLALKVLQIAGVEEVTRVEPFDLMRHGLGLVADGYSRERLQKELVDLEPLPQTRRLLACRGRALLFFNEGRWAEIQFFLDSPQDGPELIGYQELSD